MNKKSEYGFTLIELMVTLAVAAVVLTLGVPSFQDMMRNNRLTTYANAMISDLNFARSEAIKGGGGINGKLRVTMRKSGANWEQGWDVFLDYPTPIDCNPNVSGACDYGVNGSLDVDGDGKIDEIVLRQREALAANYTLRGNNNFINYISYQSNGRSNNFGSFVVCDNRDGNNLPEKNTSRLVIVNKTGRVRVGPDADKDGIPEKEDRSEITSCLSP
jgi:type IV fimbrial biogenesis protein FimT